jgi:hypothetical protein
MHTHALTRPQERERALVGGNPARFFALAQRCVWGVSEPGLVRVDVRRVVAQLRREFSALFAAHLLAAFALRTIDPTEAEHALQAAHDLADDHPWRHLLPTAGEWNGALPAQQLHEVVQGRVFRVRADVQVANTPFHVASLATIIVGDNGHLTVLNPVPLTPSVRDQVRELGQVAVLATQGRAHSRYVEMTRAMFPEARVLGTRGHTVHPATAHLHFDGLLGSDCLGPEFVELPVDGTEADEVIVLHRPTGLLVLQDLISNNLTPHEARPFAGRLKYFAFELIDRIGWLSYHPTLWRLASLQACLQRVASAPYTLVTGAHWPASPCDRAGFDTALEFALSLSPSQHKRLVARYFWQQPGFLVDFVRYALKSA